MATGFATPVQPHRAVLLATGVVALLALALATRTTITSLEWIGRTFPGFLLLEDRIVAAVALPDWPGAEVPGLFLGQVVGVGGEPAAEEQDVYAAAAATAPGTSLAYRLRRDGTERTVTIATREFTVRDWVLLFGAYLVNGVVFLTTGLLAWIMRPRAPLAAGFCAFGGCYGVFLLTAMDLYAPATFVHVYLLAYALLPATALQFALVFPEPHRLARFRFAGYPVAAVLFAAYELWLDQPARSTAVFRANTLLLAAVGLVFAGRLAGAFGRGASPLARQRARMVALGTVLGLCIPGAVLLLALADRAVVAQNAALFAAPVFPLAVTYAIAKHDLFEIDAMVKRGGTYLLLTGAAGAAYGAALLAFNSVLRARAFTDSPAFPILFTVVVLFVFDPLRTRLQAFVDRVFYRTRYDGARVLAMLGDRLAGARRRQEIVALVCGALDATIPNRGARILVAPASGAPILGFAGENADAEALGAELAAGRVVTSFDPREAHHDPDRAPRTQSALARMGLEIAVPLLLDGRLAGLLGLGPKRSGLFYTAGDAEFLRAVAQSAAIALDNARAYEALEAANTELDDRVRARTAELERAYAELKHAEAQLVQSEQLASLGRLAAGVAHEINNPVSFIAANVEPLRERLAELAGLVPEAGRPTLAEIEELVGLMSRGADRTATIVRDLRSFSRLQEAPRKAVDLHDGLEMALRLLAPAWRDRVTVHRSFGPLPPIVCDAGQMNQVFLNLLANAGDAVGPGGNVWVTTALVDGTVEVAIRDDGCGIAPEHLPRLFEPFFTTKDVGEGTGLGLAIVHGIVAAHGGRVTVESTPGGGSTFRVRLPIGHEA